MKRKHVDWTRDDPYGHWWFEIGDPADAGSESYGWWPSNRIGTKGTLLGVAGELNGQSAFTGTPTRDPHHGEVDVEAFYPLVPSSDRRTDGEIADCLRAFALSYRGGWRWAFGGQNCHTFQVEAMKHCGLYKIPPKLWF